MRLLGMSFATALLVVQAAAAQEKPTPLSVGADAPDFTLVGATEAGVLREPVRLSQFRGQAVVLAFFYRARTKG